MMSDGQERTGARQSAAHVSSLRQTASSAAREATAARGRIAGAGRGRVQF
jgi:hypothetical protein